MGRHLSDRIRDARDTVCRVKSEPNSLASNTAGLLHESKFQLHHDSFQPPHDAVKSEPESGSAWDGLLPRTRDMPLRVKSESEGPGFGPVQGHNLARGGDRISMCFKSGDELNRPQRLYPGGATREPTEKVEDWGWEMWSARERGCYREGRDKYQSPGASGRQVS